MRSLLGVSDSAPVDRSSRGAEAERGELGAREALQVRARQRAASVKALGRTENRVGVPQSTRLSPDEYVAEVDQARGRRVSRP
jgi:hypothetical protein